MASAATWLQAHDDMRRMRLTEKSNELKEMKKCDRTKALVLTWTWTPAKAGNRWMEAEPKKSERGGIWQRSAELGDKANVKSRKKRR